MSAAPIFAPNALPRQKQEIVRRLVLAGASSRQIIKLAGVAPNTANNYLRHYRNEVECEHGERLFRCGKCKWRRRIDDADLEALLTERTDDVKAIDFEGTLYGPLARSVAQEAARRGCSPAELVADILEAAVSDNLFDAILGDVPSCGTM